MAQALHAYGIGMIDPLQGCFAHVLCAAWQVCVWQESSFLLLSSRTVVRIGICICQMLSLIVSGAVQWDAL